MSDKIQLLPESIANQIHAGEVVQRPSSVVKELVENAIDAGATSIKVNIKDAGRTLIQVIDNGSGMSETDARMAFELHATSKIRSSEDLFNIRTMGFRGEALAAISIVADVELRTRLAENELGTYIHIVGSKVEKQECTQCPQGTNFMVKNLFFNTLARRKFLKKDATELKHIINEFERIALANPEVAMSLMHNGDTVYELSSGESLRKRILSIFGKASNQKLVPVDTPTNLVNIIGYVGQPKYAKKSYGEQFFFVNGRYMKHPYFHKAVTVAFDKLLPPNTNPSYFLFFELSPSKIDVNVSPNKTEVKFENEKDIWHILSAAIRESLGKFNIMPSIDFDQVGSIDIPVSTASSAIPKMPSISIDKNYNPFEKEKTSSPSFGSSSPASSKHKSEQVKHWERLYSDFENTSENDVKEQSSISTNLKINHNETSVDRKCFQLKGKYLVTPIMSGLMIINQRRAHQRILFERYSSMLKNSNVAGQQLLFAEVIELPPAASAILATISDDLQAIGFKLEEVDSNKFEITAVPAILDGQSPVKVLESMLQRLNEKEIDFREQATEKIAESLAIASSLNYGDILLPEEQHQLIDQLFACQMPNYTSTGKAVLSVLPIEDIDSLI